MNKIIIRIGSRRYNIRRAVNRIHIVASVLVAAVAVRLYLIWFVAYNAQIQAVIASM